MNKLLVTSLLFAACTTETIVEPTPIPPPTVPEAPFTVTAEGGAGFIRLNWGDRSGNEASFVIGRQELASVDEAPSAGALSDVATVVADQLRYRDDDVMPGKFYAYGVAAQNAAGRTAFTLQDGPGVGTTLTSSSGPCRISVPSAEDQDGDGLADEIEAEGWTVRVDENGMGTTTEREVTSVPSNADMDGDGLCDAFERILRTDPNRADTDGDGLSDDDEVMVYGSSAINVDSDADATGNTAFYDGSELSRYGTSPTLADTDGDGRSDFVEINQNSTNALLADLPRPEVVLVGDIDLGVNMRFSDGTTTEDAVTHSLVQEMESATGRTNSVATTVSSETSAEVGASAEVSFPAGASMTVSASYGQTDGYMKETASSVTQASSNTAQTAYSAATSRAISQQQTVDSGHLAVQVQIRNAGNRTFNFSNLVLTALTRDPRNPKTFTSVATLRLPDVPDGVTLSDGQSTQPIRVQADISANDALSLLANPSGLYFRPASFQLKDRTGTNFEFSVGEATSNRTALLVIDYGGGRDLETYRVATNVARQDGGKLAGVRMADVLESIVGLMPNDDQGYRTLDNAQGVKILTQVRNQAVQAAGSGSSKFWTVIAAENATSGRPAAARLLDPTVDFEDLLLMPRDRVYLAYQADEDRDGLFAREELLYRTSDTDDDTDDDGRTDFEEAREGWNVFSNLAHYDANPVVYSSPTRSDADADGLDDVAEKGLGTDPSRADTDGDGLADDVDPLPLSGLSAPYMRSFGTVASELPQGMVVDSNENIYLAGIGGGDIDDDGIIGSTSFYTSGYIGSWDRDGEQRWMIQFEVLDGQANNLVIDERDHVFWIGRFNTFSGFGVTANGPHIVEIDPDGNIVGINRLTYPGNPGLLTNFNPQTLRRGPNGKFLVLAETIGATLWLICDSTGVGSAGGSFSAATGVASYDVATNANVISFISGCTTLNYDWNGASIDTSNYCSVGGTIARGHRLLDGTFFKGENTSVSRFDPSGALLWTHNAPPGTQSLFALHVDALGRAYTASTMPGPQQLDIGSVTPGGSTGFDLTVPANFSSFSLFVDDIGNFYVYGTSDNGLGGLLPVRGGYDMIVLRNPQLLFE